MGWFRDTVLNWLLPPETRERRETIEVARSYRRGIQKRPLKVKPNQADDNTITNFTGLVIDRTISMLMGHGVEWDYESEQLEEYLDMLWMVNKKDILLHKLADNGAQTGTVFVKILPDKLEYDGVLYPKLEPTDPEWVEIKTNPHDKDQVLRYRIEYSVIEEVNGREVEIAYRQDIEVDGEDGKWHLRDYKAMGGRKYELTNDEVWEYDFAPMVHWQNLPSRGVYGMPDVTTDVIGLQDKYNFTSSNIAKIVRLYAHPQRVAINTGDMSKIDVGPDQMVKVGAGGDIKQLDAIGDLASSLNYQNTLRQSLFDTTRTIDISSLADKLGTLTNFGLRVLYADALAKNATKQLLYGEGLEELNRRLLILAGYTPEDGEVIFGDPLPVNEKEVVEIESAKIAEGLSSRETAAKNMGIDWTSEQERMLQEQATQNNAGAILLDNFMRRG